MQVEADDGLSSGGGTGVVAALLRQSTLVTRVWLPTSETGCLLAGQAGSVIDVVVLPVGGALAVGGIRDCRAVVDLSRSGREVGVHVALSLDGNQAPVGYAEALRASQSRPRRAAVSRGSSRTTGHCLRSYKLM